MSQADVPADHIRTPGHLIDHLLAERGWTKRVLAIVLGIDETSVSKLVSSKRAVDAPTAIALGEVFGLPAERFMELQRDYDLAKARLVVRHDPGRTARANLFANLPVTEIIKRGWLEADDARDVSRVESALAKFFGASSTDEIGILPHAAKKTVTFGPATAVQLAWLYRVQAIAREMLVARYSPSAVRELVSKLRPLLGAPEEARKVPRLLAESGIRFVIVETLPGAKIDGVCFWLDDRSPVIGLSTRYDRIDNFWFVLRHEIEHVLRLHGQTAVMLDAELEGEQAGSGPAVAEEERVANMAAAEFCVPQKLLDKFITKKAPFFYERDLLGFANTINVHPGIIAGQLQHRTGRHERFRKFLVKIRSSVAPSAIVDGWGDVAPVGQ